MKDLPTKTQFPTYVPLQGEKYADMTALAYMTADACYQMLHECTNMLLRSKQDFRGETKRRFNQFFAAMETARKCALRVGDDVSVMSANQVDWFFEDSDFLKDTLVTIYDKTKHSRDNEQKIREFLDSL